MAGKEHLLDDIELGSMSQFSYAEQLQTKASEVGFDWPTIDGIFDKIREEIIELENEVECHTNKEEIANELGDLLFACVNLARHLEINPEQAIALSNKKFINRFNYIEDCLNVKNKTLKQASLTEMDELWDEAKTKRF